MGYHVNSCKIATIFKASIFCALFWLCFILDWDGVAGQKRIVQDLVCDLEVSIEGLGTGLDTDWIKLNITQNLSPVHSTFT